MSIKLIQMMFLLYRSPVEKIAVLTILFSGLLVLIFKRSHSINPYIQLALLTFVSLGHLFPV